MTETLNVLTYVYYNPAEKGFQKLDRTFGKLDDPLVEFELHETLMLQGIASSRVEGMQLVPTGTIATDKMDGIEIDENNSLTIERLTNWIKDVFINFDYEIDISENGCFIRIKYNNLFVVNIDYINFTKYDIDIFWFNKTAYNNFMMSDIFYKEADAKVVCYTLMRNLAIRMSNEGL